MNLGIITKGDKLRNPVSLINEFPAAVGMFSVSLTAGESFETAVRNISDHGPKNIARLFRASIMDADCRKDPDIRGGILSSVPGTGPLSELRRAMNMVISAFDSPDPERGRTMMDDAEDMALASLRDTGQAYSSGLSTPCMLIFGLGIMVPMMLISFFPVLGMGGMFRVDALDADMVRMITILGIPIAVLAVILSIRGRNPFPFPEVRPEHAVYMVPMAVSVPLFMALRNIGCQDADALIVSLSTAAALSLMSMAPSILRDRSRRETEERLSDSLFELGNRLIMGDNFDAALISSLRSMKVPQGFVSTLERELLLCRGDVDAAIIRTMSPVSDEVAMHYLEVYRASRKDVRDSGGLAIAVARQLQGRASVRKDVGNRLRSMMDMMTGTSALFAPLIMGMSVAMMAPLSEMAGGPMIGDMTSTLIIYLVELAVLISVLSSNLMCRGDMLSIQSRFCLTVPVSLIVFKACAGITI